MRQDEKLTIICDGESIELSPSSHYFWKGADGMAGRSADIYTSQGSARPGVKVTGKHLLPAPFTVFGQINKKLVDYDVARETLLRTIKAGRDCKIIYENSLYERYINGVVRTAPDPDRSVFAEFEIEFFAPSPFWRGGDGDARIVTGIANWLPNLEFPEDGLEIPEEGIELEYRAPSLLVNFVNTGDEDLPMTIVFTAIATVSNPKIINVLTQEYMVVEREMLAGDVITIETDEDVLTATLNRGGVLTNVFNDVPDDATWLKFYAKSIDNPNGDNYIRAEASNDDYLTTEILCDNMLYNGV